MLKTSASATCALAMTVVALTTVPAVAAPTAGYVASSEFVACTDYDGLSALGSPLETVAGVANAGTVRVRHISGSPGPQTVDSTSVGLAPTSDKFGYATSTGRLNSTDGCTDVVIGAPDANGGAGRVVLIPGSANGLALDRALVLDAAAAGIVSGDRLGSAVSIVTTEAGVLVAAGAPGYNAPGAADAGAIVTWFIPSGGTAGTIPSPGAPSLLVQGVGPMPGHAEKGDLFGAVLAQPHQSGTAVLTIGVPNEDVSSKSDSGVVAQITFAGSGVASGSMVWPGSGMPGSKHKGDRFGASVVAPRGVIQGIGIPGLDVNGHSDAGGVVVRTPSGSYKAVTQSTSGVPGSSESGDAFGTALGYAYGIRGVEVSTVVVGVPGEDNSAGKNVGAVTLIDNGSESASLVYSMQKASGLASSGRLGQFISVVGGDLAYDEDMRDVVLLGAPGSKATSRGTYYNATTSGLSVWESGMYFATQA